MTQSQSTESTSPRRSWRGYGPQFVNLHLVFWLIVMTPSTVSLVLIWLLANMSHRGLVSVLTQDGSEGSTPESVAAKYNTQVWSPSSKNLRRLFDAVLRTASGVDQQLSTFLSGIRKSKTSSSSKTTKEQKTTEFESLTTQSNYPKSFIKGFWKTEK